MKKRQTIFSSLRKSSNFFKDIKKKLTGVKDPRNQSYITYSCDMLLLMVILKNVCNSETMRGMTNQFNKEVCISNFQTVLGLKNLEELPHYDTINNFLSELNLVEVENIRTYMIKELFKKRCFDNHKINGKDWGVIVDGTGLFCFDKKHCEHCLKRVFRNKETGEVEYMHHVLEAKLVVGNMVLSIGSEFIENESEDFDKQDCELNAFHRLAEKIKKTYNRLPICLLADSLYACEPVFKRCDQYKWNYMIRFKEGSIPSIAREFEALKKIEKENQSETICWVNEIAYKDRKLNVLEYRLLPKWVNKLATLTRSTCTSICKRVTLYQATDYSVIKTTEQITSTNPKLSYKRSA